VKAGLLKEPLLIPTTANRWRWKRNADRRHHLLGRQDKIDNGGNLNRSAAAAGAGTDIGLSCGRQAFAAYRRRRKRR